MKVLFEPSTEDEFHEALSHLVTTAEANGVPVFGGWDATRSGETSIGIEIYPVEEG